MGLFRRAPSSDSSAVGRYRGRPKVFTYHASRAGAPGTAGRSASRQKSPRGGKRWRSLARLVVVAALVVAVGHALTLEATPRVIVMTSSDGPTLARDAGVYEQAAAHILRGSIFNRSKLTINTEATAEQLMARFPELKEVSVTVPIIGQRPVFTLRPARAALMLAAAQAGPYIIDERGRVVAAVGEIAVNTADLPAVSDESGLELSVGQPALPKRDVQFIVNVKRQLSAINLAVESMILPPLPNELHVRLAGARYFVKFNLDGDARLQSGTLAAVRAMLAERGVTPAHYIDVRVAGRAFYK